MLRNFIQSLARKFGYQISRLPNRKSSSGTLTHPRKSLAESYAHLHRLGLNPDVIIDVGIANGTPELYNEFPDSYLLLVEPLPEFESSLQAILSSRRGAYILAAAGDITGTVNFNRHLDHLDGSSLLKETMGQGADGQETRVPMIRLDDIVAERALGGCMLVKIDVQGAELQVLSGACETLKKSEAVVLEVSMFEFMQGGAIFHDVIGHMKSAGFVAYDVIPGWNRPLDNAQGQLDIVFVPENSRLRKDHAFSTPEQRKHVLRV